MRRQLGVLSSSVIEHFTLSVQRSNLELFQLLFFLSDSALQHCYHHWTAFGSIVISIYLKLCSSPAIQILIFSFLASTYNDLTSGSCPWSHDLPTLPYALLYCVVGTVAPNRHIWIIDIYMPMIWIRRGLYSIFTNKKNPKQDAQRSFGLG